LLVEIEIYLVELHRHRTVPQQTPGFCGAQVRYISIYKLSLCKPNTHILPKVVMPVAIASVTNTAPQLPSYFYSQTLFRLPNNFGRSCILP
jgi:hypothetical protein